MRAQDYFDTYDYTYDNNGNILSASKNGETIKTYTYGNANWKDLLTQYNGQTITYDTIGNPLQYRDGMNFTWSNGRQLVTVTNGANNYSYTYNADGLRTAKTVNGTTTNYYWSNGILQAQKTGDEYLIFLYDENGSAYGFLVKNGTTQQKYYYLFNAQGDVIGIVDSNGTQVVNYTYDAWGDILSVTGTLASTIGQLNPIRYRGYYYDSETEFYYLQTRYYDPETGRFINADSLLNQESILGYNMFAYCLNNPINMSDSTGNLPKWLSGALNVVGGVAQMAAGAALGAFTSWTGVGAAAACFLIANGMVTTAQGVGQIVNHVTESNFMREDNIMRTGTQEIGRVIGGNTGAKVAGAAYDVAVIAAGVYAGTTIKSSPSVSSNTVNTPNIKYPGNNPAKCNIPDFKWRGSGTPASGRGNFVNMKTGEWLHPDLNHGPPIGPHWDYGVKGSSQTFRIFPDGNILPK